MRARLSSTVLACVCLTVAVTGAAEAHALERKDKARRIEALVSARHASGRFDGAVLVAEQGEVLMEAAFGLANRVWGVENTPQTRFLIGSATKQFTAILVLQLVADGRLDLEGRIADYLPEYPGKETAAKVTLSHLLGHSSGLPDFYDRTFFEEHKDRFYTHDEFVAKFIDRELDFEPGTEGAYSSSNYYLLGLILEQVTGMPFAEALRAGILDPLGMADSGVDAFAVVEPGLASGYIRTNEGYRNPPFEIPESSAYAAGAMYSTVRDLYALDRALCSGTLLPPGLNELIYEDWAPSSFDAGRSFGMGGTVERRPLGPAKAARLVHQMAGSTATGFTAVITRVPADEHLIVLLANTGPGYFDQGLHRLTSEILDVLYSETSKE